MACFISHPHKAHYLYAKQKIMSAENLFQLINVLAMLGWVLLIAVPRAKITQAVVLSGATILFIGGIYAVLITSYFSPSNFQDFSTLSGVMSLFTDPMGVVAGWAHYLAFDLFVGLWITHNGLKLGMSRWLLLPCQLLTFMFGPLGLLLFYLIRFFKTKTIPADLFQS
jgi:hypothetical protein